MSPYSIGVLSNGDIQIAAPQTGRLCEIWSMKSWVEMGVVWDGSFSQIIAFDAAVNGTGGVTNRITIKKPEIDFIKSLNVDSSKSWGWAADAPRRLLYQSKDGYSIDECVDWNWIGTPSPSGAEHPNDRNVTCFSEYDHGMARVVAIPKSTDYEQFRDVPWLIQEVYGNYGWMPPLWKMPLFEPSTFPHTKGNGGFWIPTDWLLDKVGTVKVSWLA